MELNQTELLELKKRLIKAFNKAAGGLHYKFNGTNMYYVGECVKRFDNDEYEILRLISKTVKPGFDTSLTQFFWGLTPEEKAKEAPAPKPEYELKKDVPEEEPPAEKRPEGKLAESAGNQAMVSLDASAISALCAQIAQGSLLALARQGGMDSVIETEVKAFVEREYGPMTRKVTYVIGERRFTPEGLVHAAFEDVLGYVLDDEPVYLYGPAGTGKGFLSKQVASAAGLEFRSISGPGDDYQLFGFTDAMGKCVETGFMDAYVNGKVFFLDEYDKTPAAVAASINQAISDGYAVFPAPVGMKEKHPNFRLIAAGNTKGNGADSNYTARDVLDASTTNRFSFVEVDYDPRIEEGLCPDKEALEFLRALRRGIETTATTRTVISYRTMTKVSKKLSSGMAKEKILRQNVVMHFTKDDLNTLASYVQGYGEWTRAYEKIRKGA